MGLDGGDVEGRALQRLEYEDPDLARVLKKLAGSSSGHAVGRALEVLDEAQKKGIRPHELARAIAMVFGVTVIGVIAGFRFVPPDMRNGLIGSAVVLAIALLTLAMPMVRRQLKRQADLREAVQEAVLLIAMKEDFEPKPIPDSARAELRKMIAGRHVPDRLQEMAKGRRKE